MYFAHTPNTTSAAPYLTGYNENATLSFEPGKTYRLRVLNTAALAMFYCELPCSPPWLYLELTILVILRRCFDSLGRRS